MLKRNLLSVAVLAGLTGCAVTQAPEQQVVNALADSSVDIIARYWTKRSDFFDAKTELTKSVKEASEKAGLTIPYPTTTVEYSEPKAIAKKAPAKKKVA